MHMMVLAWSKGVENSGNGGPPETSGVREVIADMRAHPEKRMQQPTGCFHGEGSAQATSIAEEKNVM